jgi:hypothetical protein
MVKVQKLSRRTCSRAGKKIQTHSDNLIMNAGKIPRETAVAIPETLFPSEQQT